MAHKQEEREELGARLALARNVAGYTMEAAASELTRRGHPLVKATIGAWEKGRNLPDALWLRYLAALYEVPAGSLLGEEQAAWPFKRVPIGRVTALEPEDLAYVEGVLAKAIGDLSPDPTAEDLRAFQKATEGIKRKPRKGKAA